MNKKKIITLMLLVLTMAMGVYAQGNGIAPINPTTAPTA